MVYRIFLYLLLFDFSFTLTVNADLLSNIKTRVMARVTVAAPVNFVVICKRDTLERLICPKSPAVEFSDWPVFDQPEQAHEEWNANSVSQVLLKEINSQFLTYQNESYAELRLARFLKVVDPAFFDVKPEFLPSMALAYKYARKGHVNIFIVNSTPGASGYAFVDTPLKGGIMPAMQVIAGIPDRAIAKVMAHEFGHIAGMPHLADYGKERQSQYRHPLACGMNFTWTIYNYRDLPLFSLDQETGEVTPICQNFHLMSYAAGYAQLYNEWDICTTNSPTFFTARGPRAIDPTLNEVGEMSRQILKCWNHRSF